jgi:hypothetical protein
VTIWDAPSLITCAKFQIDGRLVLDYALDAGKIVIVEEVRQETVDAGLLGGYPDAVEIQARVDCGRIEVRTAPALSTALEEVLDLYGLQDGDKAVVRLSLQSSDAEATVTDDRLLFVALHRCGQRALFLPDFVERAVAEGAFDPETGRRILVAVRSRLPIGFIEHSVRRLEGII